MRLTGRRESSHVDDRRRSGGSKKAGMGIGGLVVAALVVWLMGGNPLSVLTQADLGSMITTQSGGSYEPTAEEEALAKFSSQILAGTEDVWTQEFKKMGKTYRPPRLVLFTGSAGSPGGPEHRSYPSGAFRCQCSSRSAASFRCRCRWRHRLRCSKWKHSWRLPEG